MILPCLCNFILCDLGPFIMLELIPSFLFQFLSADAKAAQIVIDKISTFQDP